MATVTITIDTAQAADFLRALMTDDGFRAAIESDNSSIAVSALHQFGVSFDGVPTPLTAPPKHLASWALEADPGPYPSPAIIPTNPPSFGTCILWGVTLVAAKVK